jgi:sigma-E factor negative regulatory protein RseC
MLEEIGVVSQVSHTEREQFILVETQVKTTCGSCQAKDNCGTRTIASVLSRRREALRFAYSGDVSVGQKVKLGISEQRVLTASLLVYMVPLLALLVGAMTGQFVLAALSIGSELGVIAFAFGSAALAFLGVKAYLTSQPSGDFYPKLLAVFPKDCDPIQVFQAEP